MLKLSKWVNTDDFAPYPSPSQASCWFMKKLVPEVLMISMSSLQEASSSLPVARDAARVLAGADEAVGHRQ